MKVLLLQPPKYSSYGLQTFMLTEPLGLELIAASLEPEHEVKILDMRLEPNLRQKLASFKPDVVGVSACLTCDVYNVFNVLDSIKAYNPHIFTFAGGQHATMSHTDFIGKADAVVLGEGELTVPELLNNWQEGKPLDAVNGLAFCRDGCWETTDSRPLIKNLDESPLPARRLTEKYLTHYFINSQQPISSLEISRGCPHRCRFCCVWRFYRNTFRSRSPRRVVEDLKQTKSQYILITDDSALSDPLHSQSLIDEIRKSNIRKRYVMQLRADSIGKYPNIVTSWRNIGLQSVFVGFESINQPRLDEFGKRFKTSSIEEAIAILRDLDINLMGSFIVSPDFEMEDFNALRHFVRRMKIRLPAFSILTPLPGTSLHREKAHELSTHNYELFDLLHSTLPTKLPLIDFYRQFVGLYISSYSGALSPAGLLKPLIERRLRSHLRQTWQWLRVLKDNHPRALARHHQLSPGKLTQAKFHKQVLPSAWPRRRNTQPDSSVSVILSCENKTRYTQNEMPQMPV